MPTFHPSDNHFAPTKLPLLSERPDTQLPNSIIITTIILCITPFILNLFGVDFSSQYPQNPTDNATDQQFYQLRGAFTHTLLEWSSFTLAIFTVLLGFTHYLTTKDAAIPIIAAALFSAGIVDAFHTLAAGRLISATADNSNLIPFTWAISRVFNAAILVVGVLLILSRKNKINQSNTQFLLLTYFIFGVSAYFIIHYCATSANLPQTQFPDNVITRPYDVLPLILFLAAGLFLFPYFYKKHPSVFTHSLIIAMIPEVVVEAHMAFGSTALFDNDFNIAHALKIVAYSIPLIGLMVDHADVYKRSDIQKNQLAEAVDELTTNEIELIRAKESALLVSEHKSTFLATMSHEIRTPMNGVLGMAQLLKHTSLNDDQTIKVSQLISSGENLLAILNDILDYSKIEAGKLNIEDISFTFDDIAPNITSIYQPLATEKGIELVLDFDESLSPYYFGDPTRIRQIIFNLISNAIKFTSIGSVQLSIQRIQTKDTQHDMILVSVTDTGIGMPEQALNTIFDPFQQAESSTTRNFGGTGLGLAITKQICSLMGGEITVTSTSGEGSCFSFSIPLEIDFNPQDTAEESDTEQLLEETQPLSILIVEDNDTNAQLLTWMLEEWDHTMSTAVNGQEAVEMVMKNNYDLILMDHHMPVMDGKEATRLIRAMDAEKSKTPIIGCTADAFKETTELLISCGQDDVITKPISEIELIKVLHKYRKNQ